MKTIFFLITTFLFLGCVNHENIKTSNNVDVDSLLTKNQKTFNEAIEASKNGDSAITNKVDNTVQKIGQLETQIKELKDENNELKDKLDDADDAGRSYRIRTISNN